MGTRGDHKVRAWVVGLGGALQWKHRVLEGSSDVEAVQGVWSLAGPGSHCLVLGETWGSGACDRNEEQMQRLRPGQGWKVRTGRGIAVAFAGR